jgi:predicted HicB family RNase H-like nuclease
MPETVVHFQIRMPPITHERLASRARDEKRSLNALIVSLLSDAMVQQETLLSTKGANS